MARRKLPVAWAAGLLRRVARSPVVAAAWLLGQAVGVLVVAVGWLLRWVVGAPVVAVARVVRWAALALPASAGWVVRAAVQGPIAVVRLLRWSLAALGWAARRVVGAPLAAMVRVARRAAGALVAAVAWVARWAAGALVAAVARVARWAAGRPPAEQGTFVRPVGVLPPALAVEGTRPLGVLPRVPAARRRARPRPRARALARPVRAAGAAAGAGLGRLVRPSTVVLAAAAVALLATGWWSDRAPDVRAGEVAVAQAVGQRDGLAVPDPRVGPVSPMHALAVRAWLDLTGGTGRGLDATIRAARVPSHLLLAVAVALAATVCLLLLRARPDAGAAGTGTWSRLAVAAVAGVLAALDPVLVAAGRLATGDALALVLALAALALAWVLPERPSRRLLPMAGAAAGLALLASPLVLPTLLVPAAAARLEGRRQAARLALASAALGVVVWLALPGWAAGQDLGGRLGGLLGRPAERGSLAVPLASVTLAGAGLVAAAWLRRRHPAGRRLLAWVMVTLGGGLLAAGLGWPAGAALAFATPAAATALAVALAQAMAAPPQPLAAPAATPDRPAAAPAAVAPGPTSGPAAAAAGAPAAGPTSGAAPAAAGAPAAGPTSGPAVAAAGRPGRVRGRVGAAVAGIAVLACLAGAQAADWSGRYRGGDDALERLSGLAGQLGGCEAVNVAGADARARLLAAGVPVTGFTTSQAATARGIHYFVLGSERDAMAAWVRARGQPLGDLPSRSFGRLQLWRVGGGQPLDPAADSLPVRHGVFSNVAGSACGGYEVADVASGAFYAAYQQLGGKAVVGRPLSSVWTSDGPAQQAFDTLVLGASSDLVDASGRPVARPVDLLLLVQLLHPDALAGADLPGRTIIPPTSDAGLRRLLSDGAIARVWLGRDPHGATATDWRLARDRFGRPVGPPRRMPDGAVRQAFERVVIERPGGGGPARLAALGQVAVRAGLVPDSARRLQPVPGLRGSASLYRVTAGPLVALVAAALGLLVVGTAVAAVRDRRPPAGPGALPARALPGR